MRIIDEKGRLFGKINVIDFLVIAFFLFIMPMFYFGYKIFHRPVSETKEKIIDIPIYAIFKNLEPEVTKIVSVQDKETDNNGKVITEILEVTKIESNFITIKLSENEIITKEDVPRRQITLKMRIVGRLVGSDILHKGNSIKIGSGFVLKTAKYEVEGIIIPEPTIQIEKISKSGFTPITLDILLMNLSPDVANLVSVGDFEVDKNGDTLAKVLSVGTIEPYTYKIDLGTGDYITKTDPQKKQRSVKMEILGGVEGNAFYFRGTRIALDSKIEFNTNKYKVEGVIVREPVPIKTSVNVPITLDILLMNLSPDVANLVSVGDFEVDKNGDTLAKVLSVGTIEPYTYKIDLGTGDYITKTDPQKKQRSVKMEILGGVEGNAFYFRGTRIALDSKIEFNTNKYKVEGVIVREPVPIKKIDKKWLLLKVRFTSLLPELVDVIKEGDEDIDNIFRDLFAKVVKIESVTESMPSKVVIQPNQELTVANSPLNKDVVLLIKVSGIRTQRGLLFKEIPVKIGNIIQLQTNKYDISGQILRIEEMDD